MCITWFLRFKVNGLTFKGIQSSKNQKSLECIDFDHGKEKFDEDSKHKP
jgi:hypothetical protein